MAKAKRRGAGKPLAIAIGALVLLFAALPTATLLAIGMAPTLAAFISDMTPGRYLAKCVAGMNFAGLSPFLYKLWFTSHDLTTAIAMVSDVFGLFVIYSAAGLGWLLYLGLPGAVAMFRSLNARRRIHALREKQRDLIDEWGECILPAGEKKNEGAPDPALQEKMAEGGANAPVPASP
tara:strand:+ start:90 stop:623 length:534 start_codon:yes stop_codon:yes gene_type:complete